MGISKTNIEHKNLLPEHSLLRFLDYGNNYSLTEIQNLPHLSRSNNLSQSSHSIFSYSNLSHTASPLSQLLVIPTPGPVTVQPGWFKVVI